MTRTAATVVLVLWATGCGGDEGSGRSAMTAAEEVQDKVSDVAELVEITEDNDPNNLIGRPNGYEAAVVIKDDRLDDCGDDLGVSCGATIEEFEDADEAEERSDYIQDILEAAPIMGSEYHYLDGNLLLRVTGELKPSDAEKYEAAF